MEGDATSIADGATSDRIVFDYRADTAGPCLVVFASIHGNEDGGRQALERVRDALDNTNPPMRGRFVGVLGNLAALAVGKRFIDRDLNRGWFEDNVTELLARDPALDDSEDREQRELIAFLQTLEDEPNTPVVFLDMHSTSAEGLPFVCMPDTILNLRLAMTIPLPAILGLEESINGPLLGLLSDRGFAGVIVEGGRHDNPRTADVLEGAVWETLAGVGCLSRDDIPDFGRHDAFLRSLGHGLPRVLEVQYVHEMSRADGFQMLPGFMHYQRVRRGQVVARDNNGDIRVNRNARILMPAYETNTDQGFFLTKDVPNLFVAILFVLRMLRLDRVCHLLPGARRDADNPDLLRIAAWVPRPLINVIRLLGWRRLPASGDGTVLRRRRVRL